MKHTILAVGAAALLASCAGGPRDPGINDSQQDEFRVVTKAPLTVPPDFSLRPPAAGQAMPAEVDPERAPVTAFGSTIGQNASASERALVVAASAQAVSQVIRSQIDYEEADMIRKNQSFADRVLFWRPDDEEARAVAESDSATGGAQVTIEHGSQESRIKLPGT